MKTICTNSFGILVLIALVSMTGCIKRDPSQPPPQFDPPAGIYPTRVGKLGFESRAQKNPACIRNGAITQCAGLYVDPASDPNGSRIYHFVWIYETPAEAIARMEESAGEKVMDETVSVWEESKNVGRLLIKSGFRRYAEHTIGSCSLAYTDGPMLTEISSSLSCEAARDFLNDLTGNR